jgi:hypothetical protein
MMKKMEGGSRRQRGGYGTNQDVEGACDDDGSVSSQVGVGEEGAEQGHEAGRPRPGIDGGGGGGVGLPQRARQVGDEVGGDAEVGEAAGDLNGCLGGFRLK